ncbi:MAG: heme exporter protein CcmB [Candidatus Krumholzibacteriia bacterium]
MSLFLRQACAVFRKDVRSEARGWDSLLIMTVFALLVLVVFNFAFEPADATRAAVAPGVLWVAFVFAGILGLERSFAQEREEGCLLGLLASPLDRGALFLGKWAAAFLFMFAMELLTLPVFVVFFNAPVGGWLLALAGVSALGAAGFCAAGTVLAAVAGQTTARHLLLPILLLPLLVPLLIAAVEATALLLAAGLGADGGAAVGLDGWLRLLAAFAIVYVTLGLLLFGRAIGE